MAGLTNWPFRRLALAYGAGLTVSEMVSSVALSFRGSKTLGLLKTDPTIEKPFCVQLFGREPERLALAAQVAADQGADIIDLNFGCPAKKVVHSGHGVALLKDLDLAVAIAKRTVQAVKIPVTVKTRLAWAPGWPGVQELAPRLEAVGVKAITLHGRYGVQGFTGEADWAKIAHFAQSVALPVIGSGDVTTAYDAARLLKSTGVKGIMIGRAARGRPWLFRDCLEVLAGLEPTPPSREEKMAAAYRHATFLEAEIGPRAAFLLRTVLMWYVRDLPGAAAFRAAINREEKVAKQLELLTQAFSGDPLIES
jgi:nifR3 family TIM-barrel protein